MDKIDFVKPDKKVEISGDDLIDTSLILPDLEEQAPIVNKEVEETTDKVVEKTTEEPATKEFNKEDYLDLVGNIDSSLDEEIEENNAPQVEDFTERALEYYNKGFIVEIPDELNPDEDQPLTKEMFDKLLEHNFNVVKEKTLEEAFSNISQELQNAIVFEQQGGDIKDYINVLNVVKEIKSLDPTNTKDQILIVKEFYTDAGLNNEEIAEKIEDLKSANLLQKEATKLKPKLDSKAEQIAKEREDEQAAIAEMKNKADEYAANRITEKLVKGFEDLKFNQLEATDLFNKVMVEQNFNYGNKIQKRTGVEYLIDFHKYSETGSPERLIKAMMILDPEGKFDSILEKNLKNKVTEKLINNKVADSNKKYETDTNTKNTIKAKKFEFK